MDRFKNKYRIASARAPFWDYGWNAAYFVTICTHNRHCYFGKVVNGEMQMSDIGEIAKLEWLKTFEIRPDMNLWMGPYVVMPNHFHAIIGIGQNQYNSERGDTQCRDAMHCVSTNAPDTNAHDTNAHDTNAHDTNAHNTNAHDTDAHNNGNGTKNKFGPQSKNLASIIRGFKIGVTKNARLINPNFKWQSRYHDHIIRDKKSFHTISNYIINNPINWKEDNFFNN